MNQDPLSSRSTSLFATDPNFRPHRYAPNLLIGLAVWCAVGLVLMFFGNAFTDTLGLLLLIVEAVVVWRMDQPGFASINGLVHWRGLSGGARIGAIVLEVLFFWLVLAVYLVRAFLYERQTLA